MRLDKRIVFIHHSSNSESSVDISLGVKHAGDVLGCDVVLLDPDFDQGRRRTCVQEAIASDPDLIVAAVVAPQLLPELFDVVAERGIPWIEVGARQEPWAGLTAQVVPDEDLLTGVLDSWLLEELENRHGSDSPVDLAAWTAPALGEGLLARDRRRTSDLAAHPSVREVFTHAIVLVDLENDIRTSTTVALERHPAIKALWQTCEPCVATQAHTLDELGRSGADRPLIGGFYSNATTRQLVADGKVDGLVQVDTRLQGLIAVDLAVRHWVNGESWDDLARTPFAGHDIPLGKPWMVTAETVGPDPSTLAVPGTDPLQYFEHRWRTETT